MCDAVPSQPVPSRSESIGFPTTPIHGGSAGGSSGLPSEGAARTRLAYSQPRLVALSVRGGTAEGGGVFADNYGPSSEGS